MPNVVVPKKGPRCITLWIGLWLLLDPVFLWANRPTSYKIAHPVSWRYNLPTGEMPGWSSDFWIHFEASVQNTWGTPLTMTNKNNGDTLEFFADYEQNHAILEMGAALSKRFAFSIEVPYAYQGGGFLDNIIDGFHQIIGSNRYGRPNFDTFEDNFSVQTNSVEALEDKPQRTVSHVRTKLKYWPWQWMGRKKSSCPCGFAIALQSNLTLQDEPQNWGTNGEDNYSASWHLGIPLFEQSALWMSSAVTYVRKDDIFPDWPRNKWYQMYEMSFDFALSQNWGFIFQARADSPILNDNLVTYEDSETDPMIRLINRRSTGWNALVHWRGSQAIGLRLRHSDKSMTQLLLIEDWTLGGFDQTSDDIFVHNAPDVGVTLQTSFGF